MKVISQENYLLYVDEVPPSVVKGAVMANQRTSDRIVVVYVDREENIIGFLPFDEVA